MFSPRPRYRFYGTPNNYLTAARHVASGLVSRAKETDYIAMLENRVAEMAGVKYAIAVPQARFGIYLALKHLIVPGQGVIVSPYTIYDVINMIICAGGQPIFCDIERDTCNIDPAAIETCLRTEGDNIGAVMVTHLHGLGCDMDRIGAICAEHNVPIFEDAAQSFGARIDGHFLGSIGDVGVYSFGRAKNINGFYGGMLVTNNQELADSIRAELAGLDFEDGAKLAKRIAHCLVGDLMTFPPLFAPLTFRLFKLGALNDVQAVNRLVQTEADPIYRDQIPPAYQRRLSPMQARIIYNQLFTVDDQSAERLSYARIYNDGLRDLDGLRLPPFREDGSHIYLQYPIQLAERWEFVRYMMRHGRDLAIQHMGNASELEIFFTHHRSCPQTQQTADECVILPTYPGYGKKEVEANVEVIRAYFMSRS